jgi:hypothetical protein
MRKEDFTPDAIHDELSRYELQQNEDGFGKLGGGPIVLIRIADIEITTVSENDFHFIVDGTATLRREPTSPPFPRLAGRLRAL